MNKYQGSFEELEALIAELGYNGTWSDIDYGKQFRCDNGAILNWYTGRGALVFQGSREAREAKEQLENAVSNALSSGSSAPSTTVTPTVAPPSIAPSVPPVAGPSKDGTEREKIFVVHGHDDTAREQLELVLHQLGLDPFVLTNTSGGGLTIIEALENEIGPGANRIRFGMVLLTPDDIGYSISDGPEKAEPRARQNVVMEMGMLIAAVGRPNMAILKKGHVDVPSNADGIIYLSFNHHVKETVPRLCERLGEAGFQLEPAEITRAST